MSTFGERLRLGAIRQTLRLGSPLHRRILRASKWRIGATWSRSRQPILLLTTTGRRSGAPRTHPVGYTPDVDTLVVVAYNGGLPARPAWYLNLLAHPEVTIEVKGEQRRMRASVAEGAERDRLWTLVTARYPMYLRHQARVERPLPLVVLQPAG